MPVVIVPEAYRGPTKGLGQVEVTAHTVLGCLREVEQSHPGFLPLVLRDDGQVHRFVKLFVNEEQLEASELDAPIGRQDRLEVLAAIAGG